MNRQKFFSDIMEICDFDSTGDDEKVLAPLIKYLSEQSDEEIFSFDDIMTELLYEIDTKKNFESACKIYSHSGESFLYSRCMALMLGEEYYDMVKNGSLKKKQLFIWKSKFEAILYVPAKAWAKKHNKDYGDYPHLPTLSYETGSNKNGWK